VEVSSVHVVYDLGAYASKVHTLGIYKLYHLLLPAHQVHFDDDDDIYINTCLKFSESFKRLLFYTKTMLHTILSDNSSLRFVIMVDSLYQNNLPWNVQNDNALQRGQRNSLSITL